jgi:RimJ/RimL family protein N-acetyltransferase
MPTIETERLILRDFVSSDWDALNVFLSDPSVTRYMHFSSWDDEMRRQWLASLVQRAGNPHRDAYDWAITLRSDGQLIGWLILGRSRHARDPGMRECGCGYALNQHYWGQGYMPEALQAAFTYAFTVLRTKLIHAECEIENTASARVMQKCGMQYEGTMYDDDGLGNWEHRYRYVITAESRKNARG